MILLLLSFVAGVLTVLAPCTISLLPIIVGGSMSGERSFSKALVVTASLGVSVILFTLLLKASTALINIPQSFWEVLSGGIIILLGLATIFPSLYDYVPFVGAVNRRSNKLLATGYQKQSYVGDIIIGAALGPVFSSCSPTYFLILATVLPKSFALGLVYLLAYAVGLCGTLLLVAIAGQKVLQVFGVASDPTGWFKRSIGVLFVVVGVAILSGYDRQLELSLANSIFDVTSIEQTLLQTQATNPTTIQPTNSVGTAPQQTGTTTQTTATTADTSASTKTSATTTPTVAGALPEAARIMLKNSRYGKAPEITNPSGFINTNNLPITLAQFKGKKVVLVDFWTYSCINCQRTLPYVKAWYAKYKDEGLEVVSIHTPEFAFEHVLSNVQDAVNKDGILYPVVLDNDYGTWSAFANQYWPRKYLIDIDGYVVYDHAGEGNYDETEAAIQKALAERAQVLGAPMPQKDMQKDMAAPAGVVSVDNTKLGSPETYFGAARNEYLGNGTQGVTGPQTLTTPAASPLNALLLGGTWNFADQYAEAKSAGTITYTFSAKNVYFVASSAGGSAVTVLLDGKPVGTNAGADVAGGILNVKENRLYHVVSLPTYGQHTLQLQVSGAGLQAYTFTFG